GVRPEELVPLDEGSHVSAGGRVAAVVVPGASDLGGVAGNRKPLEVAVGLRHLHRRRYLHQLVGRPERTPARALVSGRTRRQWRGGDVERGGEAREGIVVAE